MKSFKQHLFEMPFLNSIDRKTRGFTDEDLEDHEMPSDAKHVFTASTGHQIYQHNQGTQHKFWAVNPESKKVDMHIFGLMRHGDNTFDERLIHGRRGSTIKADVMYDEIRNKLGYNIRSDTSHSRAAKRVWERLSKKGNMAYQPMSGGEEKMSKHIDAYYGPGKGVLVAKRNKK